MQINTFHYFIYFLLRFSGDMCGCWSFEHTGLSHSHTHPYIQIALRCIFSIHLFIQLSMWQYIALCSFMRVLEAFLIIIIIFTYFIMDNLHYRNLIAVRPLLNVTSQWWRDQKTQKKGYFALKNL